MAIIHEPNMVLLHGLGTSSRVWTHVAEDLGGVRPLHPDLPGFGSRASDRPRRRDDVVAFVLEALGTARFDRFVLVGHGLGAGLAMDLAARAPRGLVGVALVAPGPLDLETLPEEVVRELKGLQGDEAAVRAFYARAATRPIPDGDLELLVLDALRADPDVWHAWVESDTDRTASANALSVPLLVLAGERDPVFPVDSVRQSYGDLPGVQFEVMPDVGHFPPLEAPREVTRQLLHWTRTTLRQEVLE